MDITRYVPILVLSVWAMSTFKRIAAQLSKKVEMKGVR